MKSRAGFTLIELIVVLTIVSLLLSIAAPHYFQSVQRSKESALKQNLATLRDAIDKFYGDQGKYPEALADLTAKRYLRTLPSDPLTQSVETWVTLAPPADASLPGKVYDVRSGAEGKAADGTAYSEW
ncbi:MAG: type secretion system protein [Betaproteobacteria bacterium]|nr:type secretion system protein [Betaproteobacteria bacterium]